MAMEDLPVGCIGKLPFYGDYLVVGVGLPTSRALKEWLHEGSAAASISLGGEEDPARDDVELQTPLHVLMGLPGSTDLLAAVVRPSSGRGDRKFPFAVFAHFLRKSFKGHYAMLPLALTSVWRELDTIWESLASVASKGAFEEILESLRVPHPAPVKEVRRDYESRLGEPAGPLFQRTGSVGRDALKANLSQVVAQVGDKKNHGVRVQLPVSSDLEAACFDASFWIDLFDRQFFMKKFDPCVVFEAQRDSENRQVLLKFGPLAPEDYEGYSSIANSDPAEDGTLRPTVGEDVPGTPGGVESSYGEILKSKLG